MTWEALGAIGEIVGAVGVLATLIYLSLQIREQNRSMRIQNMRAQAVEKQTVYSMQSSPEVLQLALYKAYTANEDLEWGEQYALDAYLVSFLLSAECDYCLFREGLTSEEEWLAVRYQLKMFFHSPLVSAWWQKMAKPGVRASFAEEVDQLLAEMEDEKNPYEKQVRSGA